MLQIKEIFHLLNKKEKFNFCILIFLMIINSVFEIMGITSIIPIISITIKNDLSLFEGMFFFDYLYEFSQKENFVLLSFLFVGLVFILKNLFISFYNFFLNRFHSDTARRISNNVYAYYLNLDYKDYLKLNTSKIIYDSTEAIEIFRRIILNLSIFLLEFIVLSIIVIFLVYLNPVSTIFIILILAAISVCFFYLFGRKNFFWGLEVKKSSKKRINILNSSISSIKDVKIYSGENFFYKKFSSQNYFLNKYQKIHLFFLSLPKPFFETFIVIILLSSLYYFLTVVNISYEIIILNLAIFSVSLFRIYPSIYRIAGCFQKGNFGKAVLDDLTEIFKKEDIKNHFFNPKQTLIRGELNSLIIKGVSFRYEDKDLETLKNINLKLEKNQFIGIKGETGAGKSTLVDIISGLLKAESGSFFINGQESSNLPKNWHNNISYVPQNISLIDDTLERNIALAVNEQDIDKNKIDEVIRLSKLSKFAQSRTKDHILGERGLQVSGGEKQRIGIARALYYNREIYIFDEATNALDETTEKEILENIKKYSKNKIVIFISHKNSTLKFCDKIFNFSDGKLELIKT